MTAGRVVFGFGGESMTVAQSAIVSQWFKGKELATALGINLSTSRIGSAINGYTTALSYEDRKNLGDPLMIGLCICIVSFFFAILLCWLDKKADTVDGKDQSAAAVSDEEKFKISDIKEFNLAYWIITLNCVMMYGGIFPFV